VNSLTKEGKLDESRPIMIWTI